MILLLKIILIILKELNEQLSYKQKTFKGRCPQTIEKLCTFAWGQLLKSKCKAESYT